MKRQLRFPLRPFSVSSPLHSVPDFQVGELYLFHRTNYRCPAASSLWGIFSNYKEGRMYLESSSLTLCTFHHWHILPEDYRYCRRSSRSELRDYISGLIYSECHVRSSKTCIFAMKNPS